ncbi:hypothetical protein J5N97_010002 [Dioscorea zingiberensis]|uniref:Uncharacterized protein n=1 Tax=Dioscorea zingiberensis TaxID=325984 RepID=A0A9D5CZV0_9LILI|nr:hypothetical protein J5N97_010002 [Dioscorea zingiberensis]
MRPSRSPSTGFTPSGPSSTSLSSWAALQRRGGQPKRAQEAVRRRDSTPSSSISAFQVGEGAFEKELLGLTGGFPGGEKGLKRFIQENPPPQSKDARELGLQFVGSN